MATKESGAKPIPSFRRVTINDSSDMPDKYSSTPGGTMFSTTPGGTRIIYERAFLMNLRNSPLAKSPPKMAFIPGVTNITGDNARTTTEKKNKKDSQSNGDEPQFDMEF